MSRLIDSDECGESRELAMLMPRLRYRVRDYPSISCPLRVIRIPSVPFIQTILEKSSRDVARNERSGRQYNLLLMSRCIFLLDINPILTGQSDTKCSAIRRK